MVSLRSTVLRGFSADLWRGVLINFRGVDPWVEMVSSPIWVLGLVLAIASQNPSILRDPIMVKDICWSIVVFSMISDKLWIVGHMLDREKRNGVLENILMSNIPLAIHTLSPIIVSMLWSLASLGIILITVFPILGANPAPLDPALTAIGYILSDIVAAGIALLYAPAVIKLRRPWILTSFFQFTLPLISGIIPQRYAPPEVRGVIALNPLSYPVEILRRGATGSVYIDVEIGEAFMISITGIAILYTIGMLSLIIVRRMLIKKGI
ncbi:MAG: ABC transporter permease [Sulfolobales archaeon]